MQILDRAQGPDVVDVRVKLDQGDRLLTIWGLFDAHTDNSGCDMPLLKKTLDTIAEDDTARVVLGGDWNDMMFAKGDPRWQIHYLGRELWAKIYEADEGDKRQIYLADAVVDINLKLLGPIKNKIDIYLGGNHELKYADRHGTNVAERTADALGVPYSPYDIGMRYYIEDYTNEGSRGKVVVSEGHVYHGHGGGEVTGGTIDLYRAAKTWANKWLLRGDNHSNSEHDYIVMNYTGSFGNGRYRADNIGAANAPSFLRGYIPGKTTYARTKHMSPKVLGASCVYLNISYNADGMRVQSSIKPGVPRG